ncbi:MAG: hypothetical protein QNI91_13545 [Arenicellales bacterium]|nr:hypothetical protein [Arenicellales bacterium]
MTIDTTSIVKKRRTLLLYVLAATLFMSVPAFAHHTALPEGMSEAEAAWLWGYHTVPAGITRDGSPYWYSYAHTDVEKINNPAWTDVAAGHIKPDAKAPAVLVMHGCSGLIRSPTAYRVFFMERGYAVFEPDSFARPGHSCGSGSYENRIEDLGYAYKMIRDLPWVNHKRIILMGISEGGAAVAKWAHSGFAAHIILANGCSGGQPHAPADIPVLAVVGEKDGLSCNVARDIKGSKSIIIPGAPHGIIGYEETTQAIEELLSLL